MNRLLPLVLGLAALAPAAASAQSISTRDTFRIGSARGSGVICTAQSMVTDPAFADMFDRAYSVTCRDAALPVGRVYALRTRGGDPLQRLATIRSETAACQAGIPAELEGVGRVDTLDCRLNDADVAYRVYVRPGRGTVYVAEGLGGYESAIELALRSVVADREVAGEVDIATTGAGDPAAFARLQAGSLDPQRALAEAYRRNNAGSYAEAAAFFSQLNKRDDSPAGRAEALVNEALQRSNLGRYAEAEALFAQAAALAGTEPVTARRLRNYRAMHHLNQGHVDAALAELDRSLASLGAGGGVSDLVIDRATASRLSAESPGARRLSGVEGLTDQDKAQILDAQALQLRGTVLRLRGRGDEAVASLSQALDRLVAVREGRIAATMWMRAQILGELAALAEARGDGGEAERLNREAVALLEADYPGSAALLAAQGRLAGHYIRAGRPDDALPLYRGIVAAINEGAESSPTLRRILEPYFELLAERGSDRESVGELFAASQLLVRPAVAQAQAVLARELSGGSDEASRLFRQSVTLTRDIERARVELARLEAGPQGPAEAQRAAQLRSQLEQLRADQVATQARLAEFPRYRVVESKAIAIEDLQRLLRPGEAYYKLMTVNDDVFAIFVTPDMARAFRVDSTPEQLDSEVDALRSTISVVENNQNLTYPFDLELSHRLYRQLFAPVEGEIAGVRHLVFEPDGALLRLPPNLLVMDEAGIAAYRARAARPGDDGFDFRGVEWLGRARDISTAVSARAFRDVREAPPSRAAAEYIGFGQNAPVGGFLQSGVVGRPALTRGECSWPPLAWNRPIAPDELFTAQRAVAAAGVGGAQVVTGEAFTDSAIMANEQLDEFRVLHFATHGLVTGPRPDCPAQPALLTSFGGADSDGLLTFAEIYDLRLDADLIILSACDTAGHGSRAASEEAGVTGGDYSLDGLVRAFVGAGSRLVVGSHWPVPVDFGATQRLISGLFTAPPGTGTAAALRQAQLALMDQADTSHPYYWSGFAVIGDGSVPVIRTGEAQPQSGH